MNCKQGDLAIIVKSYAGNEGKIVRCVEYLGLIWWHSENGGPAHQGPGWRVDRHLRHGDRIADDQLRPIRPDSEPTSFESHRELEHA